MFSNKPNLSEELLRSVLIIYFLITFVVTSLHVVIEYSYTKSNIKSELKTISSIFEPPMKSALWDLNYEQLESISSGIIKMPLIFGISIVDPNGKELIKKKSDNFLDHIIDDSDLSYTFIIHQKFNNEDIYLAKVIIYSDNKEVVNRLKVGFSIILFNSFVKSIALVLLFIFAFKKHLEIPLDGLTKKIANLEWEHKANRHIDMDFIYDNELSILKSKFNQLLEKISTEEDKRFELVKNQNIKLEQDIDKRTKELQEANEKLQKLATTDVLTQLDNRLKIDERLLIEYNNFKRHKRVFSIIMMDIDYFKKVNDVYGHQVGDYVLQTISSLLKQHIRGIDIVGRWGGEEFLIICHETDIDGAFVLAENIRAQIDGYDFENVNHITVSLGVAQIEKDMSMNDLVKKADDALYEAKNSGRNRTIIATY